MIFRKTYYWQVLFIISVIFCIFAISSCAPSAYKHPELNVRVKKVKVLGMIPPDVKIYELGIDGVLNLVDEWSEKGRENVSKAITEHFKENSIEIKPLTVSSEDLDLMQAFQTLYWSVSAGIDPEKKDSYYSIGSIEDILKKYGVDALIFVYARDEISTVSRKAKGFMVRWANIMAESLVGVQGARPLAEPREGGTVITIGLVEKSGSILWYKGMQAEGAYDLRDSESTKTFIEKGLSDFPGFKK